MSLKSFMLMFNLFLIFPYMKFWKFSLMTILMSFIMMKFNMLIYFSNLTNKMGCDMLSFCLILLTIFIFSLSILSSKSINKINIFYYLLIYILFKMLMILFLITNWFLFYSLFELSLIPMMMMILGWGMKVERMQASVYFIFYTMFSSLPFLYYLIMYMYINFSNFMFINSLNEHFKDFFFILFFSMAFLVKMPIFMFHLWLPKAHVEAPVSGSMILAGILLKLGGYGIIRTMLIMMELMFKYSSFFITFSIWGGLIISFSCLNQLDMKMIVAFSSVSHMSLLIGGLFSMNSLGLYGSFLIMIAHGLTSSGLFFLVNIFYYRTHSRSLIMNKGLINISPNLSMSSFLIISSGMAAPPTINLLSEFLLSYSMIMYFSGFMFILFFMLIMSVCYSMYWYSFNLHGKLFLGMFFFKKMFLMEYLLIFLHWIPVNLLILKSELYFFF